MKKILSLVLVFALICPLFAVSVSAQANEYLMVKGLGATNSEIESMNQDAHVTREQYAYMLAKLMGYKRAATWRIVLVSNAMIFGIAAFYLMGAYQSMLWIAAVSAIGWYFTKPSEAKLQAELQPKDPQQEQY